MFYKPLTLKEEIKKSFERLLVPFFWFSLIGTFIFWIKLWIENNFTPYSILASVMRVVSMGSLSGNQPLWFLLSLFCVRVIYSWLYGNYSHSRGLIKFCFLFIACLIGSTCIIVYHIKEKIDIPIPYYISNISSGMIFFVVGSLWKKKLLRFPEGILCLILYIFIMLEYPIIVDMRSGRLISGNYISWFLVCFLGIVSSNSISYHILNFKNFFSNIGTNTMPYYCLHWIIIVLVSCFYIHIGDKPNYEFLGILIGCNILFLPLITIFIKKSKWKSIIK